MFKVIIQVRQSSHKPLALSLVFCLPCALEFQVLDKRSATETLFTTVTGVTDLNNLLQQAKDEMEAAATLACRLPALTTIRLRFLVWRYSQKAGDSFDISFNTNGIADNRKRG